MSKRVRKPNCQCYICGKPFYCPPSRQTGRNTCSRKCQGIFYSKYFVGKNHPQWKGGEQAGRQRRAESNRKRAKEWYGNNKEYAQQYHRKYYRDNMDTFIKKFKEYARANPSVNKEAVQRWRENNPDRDPRKYRITGKLRKKVLLLWENVCPICGREFTDKGYLKPIIHHLRYQPEEWVVVVCYQCHNLIHGRKVYRHPLVTYSGDMAPHVMAMSILALYERFIKIKRLYPRKLGGSRKKESEAILVTYTKKEAQQITNQINIDEAEKL